jgi:hypothetical protein
LHAGCFKASREQELALAERRDLRYGQHVDKQWERSLPISMIHVQRLKFVRELLPKENIHTVSLE